jgi:hypothetical protein
MEETCLPHKNVGLYSIVTMNSMSVPPVGSNLAAIHRWGK